MEDGKQLSTTSKPNCGTQLPTVIRNCPVAQRMMEQLGADGPSAGLAAVAVVAAVDRSITTATESVRSTGQVSVKRFAKDFDERTLAALILTHLTIVEDMVNVARPMKPEAMAMLAKNVAKLLTDDDMTVNLADIQIVADRLANGEAGQVYGGLNTPMVMKAFTDYLGEKGNAFADLRERQAKEQFGSFGERTGESWATERKKHREAMHDYQLQQMKKNTQKDNGNGKS